MTGLDSNAGKVKMIARMGLGQQVCRPFEINRIPKRDRSDNQVQSAGAVTQLFERAVADFPEPVDPRYLRTSAEFCGLLVRHTKRNRPILLIDRYPHIN